MKTLLLSIIVTLTLLGTQNVSAQETLSPNKFIDLVLKDDYSLAVRVPGWVVRTTGRIASIDLDGDEKRIVKELSKSIKKIRVLVNTKPPEEFKDNLAALYDYFGDKMYDEYIQVRSEGNNISLWAQQKNKNINNIVLVVHSDEDDSAIINMKTDISLDNLKSMDFFQEMKKI